MSADIREYLIDRFQTDATTLRQRAAALRESSKPAPGPDATISRAMADACEDVVALVEQLPSRASVDEIIAALRTLLPELVVRANNLQSRNSALVKSVYVGAGTRVQELIAAELKASANVESEGGTNYPAIEAELDEDDE